MRPSRSAPDGSPNTAIEPPLVSSTRPAMTGRSKPAMELSISSITNRKVGISTACSTAACTGGGHGDMAASAGYPRRAVPSPGRRHERTPGALPVEDLFPQDVCVPAVLGEFAQYVEVHPAQRERAAPVAVDPVVQPQG